MPPRSSHQKVRVVFHTVGPPERSLGLCPWEGFQNGCLAGVIRSARRGDGAHAHPEQVPASTGLATLTCGTDNQGNTFLFDTFITTKYPLAVVLMELSCQLGRRRAAVHARLLPRLQNEEADALNNEDFHHVDEALRMPVRLGSWGFIVLHELFTAGEEFVKEIDALKSERTSGMPGDRMKRSRLAGIDRPLREREPWG